MRPRLVATTLVAAASLLLLPACSADEPDVARDVAAVTTTTPTDPTTNPLAGTWSTPPIAVSRMVEVARLAGFATADVDEFRASMKGVRNVVYTLKLTDDLWVVFESRDGTSAEDLWVGPYEVLDDSTVRAGAPPCGPITYDYELTGDELSLEMTDDQCFEADGKVPAGELLAQTVIYQSAPYHPLD